MAAEKEEKTGREQPASRSHTPLDIQQALRDLAGLAQQPPGMSGQVITPVDLQRLLRLLRDIPTDVVEPDQRIDPLRRELLTIVKTLQAMSTELVIRQLEDGLSWIYHPVYGGPVAAARIRQLIHVLATSIRRMWYHLSEQAMHMPPNELREAVEAAEAATKLAFLVITDMWAKIMTLYFSNAPPEARPPLVNAALGYELVGVKTPRPPSRLLDRLMSLTRQRKREGM